MQENQPQNFSEYFALQWNRLMNWVKPDPKDPVALTIVKTILKSIVVILLFLISPVLILGLALAFVGAF